MKNAGKACNNRLYRHIRTFEKIVKNYFVIYIENYLQCAVVARNIAAHGGRFYNRTRLSPAVKLPLVMRRAHVDNSSPFAYFYAIFELLPDAEKFNLIRAMEKLFKKYPAAEPSRMGFPVNWKALLNLPSESEEADT